MSRKRRKKKSGCVGFAVVLLIIVLCVAVFVYGDMFSKIRLGIDYKLYPLKYEQEIIDAGEKYDLEPELIAAVIYAESKFDEEATSSVGARGLMQLMPDTLDWLSRLLDEPNPSGNIEDPETNIKYGTYYLKHLMDRFGSWETALAAYNAGHGRVSQWLKDERYSKDGSTLYNIPIEETKNYVNKLAKLLRNLSVGATGVILVILTGIISIQGLLSETSDGILISTAKYSMSNFIPIVGGFTSETVELFLKCMGTIRNVVGIFGIIIIVLLMAIPIIKILTISVIYKITAALVEPITESKIADGLNDMGSCIISIASIVFFNSLLFVIFITTIINIGGG